MYGDNPQVLKDYAAFAGVSEAMAKRVRDEFFPRALVMPDEIKGLDSADGGCGRAEIHLGAAEQGADRRAGAAAEAVAGARGTIGIFIFPRAPGRRRGGFIVR